MRISRWFVLLSTVSAYLAVSACDGAGTEPLTPFRILTPSGPMADQWPDTADFTAAGEPRSGSLTLTVSGAWSNDTTHFRAVAHILEYHGNDISGSVSARLLDNGTTVNSGSNSFARQIFALPLVTTDTTLVVEIATTKRCGLIGKSHGTASASENASAGAVTVQFWIDSTSKDGADQTLPNCRPPNARVMLSYGAASGANLDIAIPENNVALVGIDGSGSTPGQSGGPGITGYAWLIGSTNMGGSESFSASFSASHPVSLTVTDADGATGSATGGVTISYVDLCDDPATHDVEDCESNPPSGSVSVDGGGSDDAQYYEGGWQWSVYVCYVTDWFQWNGSAWVYQNSHLDYCGFE